MQGPVPNIFYPYDLALFPEQTEEVSFISPFLNIRMLSKARRSSGMWKNWINMTAYESSRGWTGIYIFMAKTY